MKSFGILNSDELPHIIHRNSMYLHLQVCPSTSKNLRVLAGISPLYRVGQKSALNHRSKLLVISAAYNRI